MGLGLAMSAAGRTLCAAALLACAGAARADCIDGSEPGTVTQEGRLHFLPPGTIAWRIGVGPMGFGHSPTFVALRWTEGSATRNQVLFAEMQDGRPVLGRDGGALRLRVTYCLAGGVCRHAILAYRWDAGAHRFVGANAAARRALATACVAAANE